MNPTRGVAYAFWLDLERLRLDRGWTQVELAERAKVPRSTINRLKDSARPPYVKTVHKLADAVGLDRDEAVQLAGLKPAAEVQPAIADLRAELEREIQAIGESNDIPEPIKQAMIKEARRLAARQEAELQRFLDSQATERRDALDGWANIARGGTQMAT